MGKAAERQPTRIAAEIHRDRTGFDALGTANLLGSLDSSFEHMLKADEVNAIDDREWRQIRKARLEVANAAKRLHVIAKRCCK